MNLKTIIIQFFVLLMFVLGCSSTDLSTPEKNYYSFYSAIQEKNFNTLSKCFDSNVDLYKENNIRILAKNLFNDINIVSHRIIKTENIDNKEASIVAEEVMERENKIRTKSTFRINYTNSNGIWKVISTETLSFEILTDGSK